MFEADWNAPEKMAGKFSGQWALTENLGWRDDDVVYFHFKSHRDDVIISSRYRLGLEEIKDTVARHDAVADVGVTGVPDDERGSVAKAFVRLRDGFQSSAALRIGFSRSSKTACRIANIHAVSSSSTSCRRPSPAKSGEQIYVRLTAQRAPDL